MNPYPFESLNHFTVPVAIQTPPPPRKERAGKAHSAPPVLAQLSPATVAGRPETHRVASQVSTRALLRCANSTSEYRTRRPLPLPVPEAEEAVHLWHPEPYASLSAT